jgi:hypothetical protein
MALTPDGTPYIESSDLVADYPGISLALANHIDTSTGKVLQVASTTKTDTFSSSSTSFVDVTGLTVSITPGATSNKVLVFFNILLNNNDNFLAGVQLLRGATAIGGGTAVGSRTSAFTAFYTGTNGGTIATAGNFLDSPASTSEQTYKIQLRIGGGGPLRVNTSNIDADAAGSYRTSSTITVMEISA